MLNIRDGQRVMVWEVEDKDKYSLVKMSSSRKDKKSGEYVYSNWSYVRFVGTAYKKSLELEPKDIILLKGAGVSNESYMKEGTKTWPKVAPIVVFNFEIPGEEESEDEPKPKAKSKKPKMDEPPVIDDDNEDLPF